MIHDQYTNFHWLIRHRRFDHSISYSARPMKRSRMRSKALKPKRRSHPMGSLGVSMVDKTPWRSREHRELVRAQGCLVVMGKCWGPIDPHHVTKWRGGGGAQPSDALVVPLCRKHHGECQGHDREFENKYGISFRLWIRDFSEAGRQEIDRIEDRKRQP